MGRDKKQKLTLGELIGLRSSSRREFLRKIALGGNGVVFLNRFLVKKLVHILWADLITDLMVLYRKHVKLCQ